MKYEIVTRRRATLAGLRIRTCNSAPDMSAKIGTLWSRFYGEGIYSSIPGKVNEKAVGLYTNYDSKEQGEYDVFVGCETARAENLPDGTDIQDIPAGRYAKFVVRGQMRRAVREFWEKLWQMELPRAFTCDFEEYQNADMEDAVIHIYISLKEEKGD